MGFTVDLVTIAEDKLLRYGLLFFAMTYPGMGMLYVTLGREFIKLDAFHIIVLTLFYSLPFFVSSTVLVLTLKALHKKPIPIGEFITTTSGLAIFSFMVIVAVIYSYPIPYAGL